MRHFLAQGFLSGAAMVTLPSWLSLLGGARPAAAQAASCGLTAGAGKIPFVCFDLAGGANVFEPEDLAVVPGALLVGPRGAERWHEALKQRTDPWQLVYPLGSVVDASGPRALARTSAHYALELREKFGAAHLTLVHRRDPQLRPHLIVENLAAKLKPAEIRQLLHGNLVRMLEDVVK